MDETLRPSPLDDRHRALGASMTGFAGWDMPLDYGSVVGEHGAVRTGCGVFDLSHLGTLRVTGPGAEAAVRRTLTNDVAALPVGRAHYSLCLDDEAGIVDDLLVYRLPDALFVVPNAANAAAVAQRLREAAASADGGARVTDVKDDLACLAIQGPQAAQVATGAGFSVEGMAYLDCGPLGDGPGVLARSGYTGEVGFEAFVPVEDAPSLWDRVLAAGAAPVGLGARDTLRLEMGYPLHGQDISPATTPVEAGLGWAVRGTGFAGAAACAAAKERGAARRLRGLRATGRGIPRAHCRVSVDGEVVGETTSGTFSPTLRVGVAMAYLDVASATLGSAVSIDVRGRAVAAEVVRPPMVPSDPRA